MRMRVRYSGRVQGVGFRATAHSIAAHHDVTGWVRNETDGSVLLEVQGPAAVVKAMMDELQSAMRRNIKSMDVATLPDAAQETDFEIRYE